MNVMSLYYNLEAKRMHDELVAKLRQALCEDAARMHLRSRGEEENDETVERMVQDVLSAIKENKYKLPDWPAVALDPFNAIDVEESSEQLRKYLIYICVIFEDLGYGPYIPSDQTEATKGQQND